MGGGKGLRSAGPRTFIFSPSIMTEDDRFNSIYHVLKERRRQWQGGQTLHSRNSIVGVIQIGSKCVQATVCNTVTVHCQRTRPCVCSCLIIAWAMGIHKGFLKLGEVWGQPASIWLSQYGV